MRCNSLSMIMAIGFVVTMLATSVHAQNSSLFTRRDLTTSKPLSRETSDGGEVTDRGLQRTSEEVPNRPYLTLRDGSMYYVPVTPPREIQKHDIVSVRVDILSRMQADGELQRRKNALYDVRLKDWITLDGFRAVRAAPQTSGDPRMRGEMKSNYRSLGEVESRESLAFNLAAEVADIRPNGNLVLEGRAKVVLNDEMWTYVLSGVCRPEAIGPDNVVLSRDIINLDIQKVETGSVAAGYQRGWFTKLFDLIQPF